jgi:hypothetical protein
MHVVGHQDISMDPAVIPRRGILQAVQIETIIFVSEEAWCAVVAALDDVQGLSRYYDSRETGHDVF